MEPDASSRVDVLWGSVEGCSWVTQQGFGKAFSSSKNGNLGSCPNVPRMQRVRD